MGFQDDNTVVIGLDQTGAGLDPMGENKHSCIHIDSVPNLFRKSKKDGLRDNDVYLGTILVCLEGRVYSCCRMLCLFDGHTSLRLGCD